MSNIDYSRLLATLATSKMQSENNALYQTILGLITGVRTAQEGDAKSIADLQAQINGFLAIKLLEIETAFVAVTLDLDTEVQGMTIIKDQSGNANANNITLTGVVEGVTNPVINVNFDTYKVYKGGDGLYHTW